MSEETKRRVKGIEIELARLISRSFLVSTVLHTSFY